MFKKFTATTAVLVMLITFFSYPPTLATEGLNLCQGAELISSSPASGASVGGTRTVAANMFDGDTETYLKTWTNVTEGTYILDLKEKKSFNRVSLYKPNDQKRSFKLTVQVSDDESTWTDAMSGAEVPATSGTEISYDIPKASGQYVKFYIHDISPENGYSGFAISEVGLYMITDTTPPVITLVGSENIDLDIGDAYSEPGYSASDNVDGDLTESVIVSGDIVDTATQGVYTIRYNVSDSAGNVAQEKIRTVSVGIDKTPPVISLKGLAQMEIGIGMPFVEEGYTATDNVDGDITENVIVSGDSVNTQIEGTYIIKYDVEDSSGNKAETVTRTVKVIGDFYGRNLCAEAILVTGNAKGAQDTFPANMFDGNSETRYRSWMTANCTGEFILALGTEKQFNQLALVQAQSDVRAFSLSVQIGGSAEGPWENITEPVDIEGNAGGTTVDSFETVRAQYVRFYINDMGENSSFFNIAEIQLYMDKASYIISEDAALLMLPSKTGRSLSLLSEGTYGSKIVWSSSDEKLITDEGVLVSRPAIGEENIDDSVVMTAKISFDKAFIEKKFEVTVTSENIAEKAMVSGAGNATFLIDADYTTFYNAQDGDSFEIIFDKPRHINTAEFELSGENNLSKIELYGYNGEAYTLLQTWQPMARSSASVYIEFNRGTYEKLKFSFRGVGVTEINELLLGATDEASVQYLLEILTVSEEPLDKITKDLILDKKGEYGQKITWKSSDTSVLLDNGTVLRGSSDTDVYIVATITNGSAQQTRRFDITVLKNPSPPPSYNDGGGSGGGIRIPAVKEEKKETAQETILGMNESHWAYECVKKLSSAGVISGNENGDFEPDKEITRAEYIKILVTAFGIKEQGEAIAFNDVSDTDWYAEFISIARSRGIVTGDENNCVMPNKKISRQDMAVMLGRAMEITEKAIKKERAYIEFSDEKSISSYASPYVEMLYCAGIIDGMGEGNFAPADSATKAQAAKLIASIM